MADVWAEFIQSQHTSKHSTQSAALEDSASALIQRLEEFGSRSSVRALAERLAAEEAAPDAASPPQPSPPAAAKVWSPPASEASAASSSTADRTGCAAADRLYQDSRARRERKIEKENKRQGPTAEPHINARSRALAREGAVGARLYESARQRAEKLEAARSARAARELAEAEAKAKRAPEINEVSAQLAGERAGEVGSRLYEEGKEAARRQFERTQAAEHELRRDARPEVSEASARIAEALHRGDARPVQERLYSEAAVRDSQKLATQIAHHEAEAAAAERSLVSEASRRIAERAAGGRSLEERLASRGSLGPERVVAPTRDVIECVHAPAINARSERLVAKGGPRDGPVEERLLAWAESKDGPVAEEHTFAPQIDKNSERILQRRGAPEPLEKRLMRDTVAAAYQANKEFKQRLAQGDEPSFVTGTPRERDAEEDAEAERLLSRVRRLVRRPGP